MDANCCAECGFTTTNILAFTSHITQHEEDHKTDIKAEWNSSASEDMFSPTSSPPLASLSINEAEQLKRLRILSNLPPLDGLMTAPSSNGSDEEKMICSSSSSSGSVSPNEGEITTITAAAKLLFAKTEVQMPLTSDAVKKSNKAMHVCPHCNFTTFMSQHMKSHLEAHERHQGQMYQCDICQMQFSQKANMHRHRMRHSGVKPYECRYCKKRFFRKDQMQEHSMTHIKTGADFDCPVQGCALQFGQHSVLRTHLDEAHQITSGTPASCKRCSLLFANSRRLLLHYQTKHDEGDTSGINVATYSENGDSPISSPPKKRRASVAPSAPPTPATLPTIASTSTSTFVPTSTAGFFGSAASLQQPAAAATVANPLALLQARLEEMVKMHTMQQMAAAHQAAVAAATQQPLTATLPQQLQMPQSQRSFHNGLFSAPKLERYSPDSDGSIMSNEELMLALSNQAHPNIFGIHDSKSIWRSTTDSVSNMTATASDDTSVHSPSVDSNHSATELDDDLAKEPQECTHCDISFKDKTLYLLHKGLHSEFEPWKCNLCGHNCGDKYMFTTHVISVDHSI